jgi:hypothetical protein
MARLSNAFLFDRDSRTLDALAYGFAGEDCGVTKSSDLAAAASTASTAPFQIAVVVLRHPAPEILDFLERLRREHRGVPILLLGPAAQRSSIKNLGRAAFLDLPVFVKDVLTASRMLVALQESGGSSPEDQGVVKGALSDYGLFYLVRTMIALRRSGILQVDRATRHGEIRFLDGHVTAAEVGSLQGVAALHHLLLWEEASLELKLRSSVRRGSLQKKSEDLLEEAERFMRDVAHATKELGSTQATFLADADKAAAAGDALPGECAPVVRLFDGHKTLGDVIEDSPFRVLETVRIATRLLDLGVLQRQEPAAAPATGKARSSIADWFNPASAAMVTTGESADPPPAQPQPKDQREGHGNRRKGHRKAATESARNGHPAPTPAPALEARPPAVDGTSAAEQARPSDQGTSPIPTTRKESLSGTFDTRGRPEARNIRRQTPAFGTRPSVVIDLGTDTPSAPVATSPIPMAEPAKPPQTARQSAQMVGVVDAGATSVGQRTSRSSSRHSTLAARPTGSIELDPALAMESAGQGPSGHHAIDGTSVPAPAPPSPASVSPSASAPSVVAVAAAPRGRRPSNEFNALEADFFAREADLYQEEGPETFDDMDPDSGGRNGTRRPSGR